MEVKAQALCDQLNSASKSLCIATLRGAETWLDHHEQDVASREASALENGLPMTSAESELKVVYHAFEKVPGQAATTKETLPGGPCVYDTIDNSVLYLDGPYKSAGVSFTRTRTELIGRRVLVCLARLSSQPSKIGAYRVGCYQRGEFIPDRYEQVLPCFCLSRRTVDVELDSIEKTLWHIAHTMGVEAKQRIVLAATRLARDKADAQVRKAQAAARREAEERTRRRTQERGFRERDQQWLREVEHKRQNAWSLRGGNETTDPHAAERARLGQEVAAAHELIAEAAAEEAGAMASRTHLKKTLEAWGRFTPRGESAVKMRGLIARAEA